MKKVLIVYYSRTGYTRKIAAEIAERLGADLEGIEEPRGRSGLLGYIRSAREALKKRSVEIRRPAKRASSYDLTIIGGPVWAGHLSSPVRGYIADYGQALERVAFFCTQGGSGAEKVFDEMAAACGRPPEAVVAVDDREIDAGAYGPKLTSFLVALDESIDPQVAA